MWRDRKFPSKLPITSAAFTIVPVVASYSAIVPEALFATNRPEPDTAIPVETSSPETGAAFTTPRGGVFADLAGMDRDKDRVGACCADRERCEQDGEQTAPPVLAQPLQCFLPPSFDAIFLPTTIRMGQTVVNRLYEQPQSSQK
jgi:hypothetical protein